MGEAGRHAPQCCQSFRLRQLLLQRFGLAAPARQQAAQPCARHHHGAQQQAHRQNQRVDDVRADQGHAHQRPCRQTLLRRTDRACRKHHRLAQPWAHVGYQAGAVQCTLGGRADALQLGAGRVALDACAVVRGKSVGHHTGAAAPKATFGASLVTQRQIQNGLGGRRKAIGRGLRHALATRTQGFAADGRLVRRSGDLGACTLPNQYQQQRSQHQRHGGDGQPKHEQIAPDGGLQCQKSSPARLLRACQTHAPYHCPLAAGAGAAGDAELLEDAGCCARNRSAWVSSSTASGREAFRAKSIAVICF